MCRKVVFLLIFINQLLLRNTINVCGDRILYGTRESIEGHDVWIEYFTRPISECPHSDFQCYDNRGCYNSSDNCNGNFICKDHSDEIGCDKCAINSALCNKNSDHCFDPVSQRCDGKVHCPAGEDELSCTKFCPHSLQCPNEQKCITQEDLCNQHPDCAEEFDEINCPAEDESSNMAAIIVIFIISSVCSVFFFCLIFRWVTTRRNMTRLLENPPEFPLAPFRGPGDQEPPEITTSETFTDADFLQGGEIYESYLQSVKNRRNRSAKSLESCMIEKYSYMDLDGDNELIVLASLNVPREMCIGLTVPNEDLLTVVTKENPNVGPNVNTSKTNCRDKLENLDHIPQSTELLENSKENFRAWKALQSIKESLRQYEPCRITEEPDFRSINSSESEDRSSNNRIILVKSKQTINNK